GRDRGRAGRRPARGATGARAVRLRRAARAQDARGRRVIRRFSFRQILVGGYRWLDAPANEHPLSVNLRAGRPRLLPPRSGPLAGEGESDAQGLANRKRIAGSIERARGALTDARYELAFEDDPGRELRLSARRRATLGELLSSLSRVTGAI